VRLLAVTDWGLGIRTKTLIGVLPSLKGQHAIPLETRLTIALAAPGPSHCKSGPINDRSQSSTTLYVDLSVTLRLMLHTLSSPPSLLHQIVAFDSRRVSSRPRHLRDRHSLSNNNSLLRVCAFLPALLPIPLLSVCLTRITCL
jgi:hypothetical protein